MMITPEEARRLDAEEQKNTEVLYSEIVTAEISRIGPLFRGVLRQQTINGVLPETYANQVAMTLCNQAKEAGWGDFDYSLYYTQGKYYLNFYYARKKPWWKFWSKT